MPATTVVMPKMGYDMTQGKIVRWLKHEGDRVQKGESIAEIETEKVNIEIEAFASGIIQKITVPEGETVPVGQPIALIGEPGEQPAPTPPVEALPRQAEGAGEGAEAPAAAVGGRAPGMGAPPAAAPAPPEEERVKASPVARKMAEEQGIELKQVQGTGPGGRITKEDIQQYLTEAARRRPRGAVKPPEAPAPRPRGAAPAVERPAPIPPQPSAEKPAPPPPAPAAPAPPAPPAVQVEGVPVETRELSKMGQAVARVMAESKRTVPHFYATVEIDMSRVASLRDELNPTLPEEEQLSFNDFVLKAAALALTRFPAMNASYGEGKLSIYQEINVAMAVALEEGLITPVIRNCDRKSLTEIGRESKDLAARAREGKLRQEMYGGGTFTVSNLGMLGVEEFAAIINPPQAAILAVGSVELRPAVRDGILAVARTMKATISVDHRAVNGADAARFLKELRGILENPARLLV